MVAIFKHALMLKKEHGVTGISPINMAHAAAGGASKRQIYNWLNQDLSNEAHHARAERHRPDSMFTEDQIALIVGFACSTRSSLRTVNAETLQRFCETHLQVKPSRATISRILNKHGLTSQKALTRNSRMVTEEVVDDALGFIAELREYGFEPDQIIIMDETGLWSNVKAARTYHFKNWYDNYNFLFFTTFVGFCLFLTHIIIP